MRSRARLSSKRRAAPSLLDPHGGRAGHGPALGALLTLAAFAAGVVAIVFAFVPAIPQPAWYHDFADRRAFLGVPNFLDTASNLFFLAIGLAGLVTLPRARFIDARERRAYAVFFGGLTLTAFASAWYHLAPVNAGLVWDRLAMTLAFAGFFAALIQERLGARAGSILLACLLVAGPGAVLYWYGSELAGAGDLRPYFLLQGLVMFSAPLLLGLWPGRYDRGSDWFAALGIYLLALALEWLDKALFAATGLVSGHTLKHLAAAAAGWMVLHHLRRRRPLAAEPL